MFESLDSNIKIDVINYMKFIVKKSGCNKMETSPITITQYNTDISNWGEEDNLILKGTIILDKSLSFEEVLEEAKKYKAPIIIKTSYVSEKKPGAYYIKGTHEKVITYDMIKEVCESNHSKKKYKNRYCYLIKY